MVKPFTRKKPVDDWFTCIYFYPNVFYIWLAIRNALYGVHLQFDRSRFESLYGISPDEITLRDYIKVLDRFSNRRERKKTEHPEEDFFFDFLGPFEFVFTTEESTNEFWIGVRCILSSGFHTDQNIFLSGFEKALNEINLSLNSFDDRSVAQLRSGRRYEEFKENPTKYDRGILFYECWKIREESFFLRYGSPALVDYIGGHMFIENGTIVSDCFTQTIYSRDLIDSVEKEENTEYRKGVGLYLPSDSVHGVEVGYFGIKETRNKIYQAFIKSGHGSGWIQLRPNANDIMQEFNSFMAKFDKYIGKGGRCCCGHPWPYPYATKITNIFSEIYPNNHCPPFSSVPVIKFVNHFPMYCYCLFRTDVGEPIETGQNPPTLATTNRYKYRLPVERNIYGYPAWGARWVWHKPFASSSTLTNYTLLEESDYIGIPSYSNIYYYLYYSEIFNYGEYIKAAKNDQFLDKQPLRRLHSLMKNGFFYCLTHLYDRIYYVYDPTDPEREGIFFGFVQGKFIAAIIGCSSVYNITSRFFTLSNGYSLSGKTEGPLRLIPEDTIEYCQTIEQEYVDCFLDCLPLRSVTVYPAYRELKFTISGRTITIKVPNLMYLFCCDPGPDIPYGSCSYFDVLENPEFYRTAVDQFFIAAYNLSHLYKIKRALKIIKNVSISTIVNSQVSIPSAYEFNYYAVLTEVPYNDFYYYDRFFEINKSLLLQHFQYLKNRPLDAVIDIAGYEDTRHWPLFLRECIRYDGLTFLYQDINYVTPVEDVLPMVPDYRLSFEANYHSDAPKYSGYYDYHYDGKKYKDNDIRISTEYDCNNETCIWTMSSRINIEPEASMFRMVMLQGASIRIAGEPVSYDRVTCCDGMYKNIGFDVTVDIKDITKEYELIPMFKGHFPFVLDYVKIPVTSIVESLDRCLLMQAKAHIYFGFPYFLLLFESDDPGSTILDSESIDTSQMTEYSRQFDYGDYVSVCKAYIANKPRIRNVHIIGDFPRLEPEEKELICQLSHTCHIDHSISTELNGAAYATLIEVYDVIFETIFHKRLQQEPYLQQTGSVRAKGYATAWFYYNSTKTNDSTVFATINSTISVGVKDLNYSVQQE